VEKRICQGEGKRKIKTTRGGEEETIPSNRKGFILGPEKEKKLESCCFAVGGVNSLLRGGGEGWRCQDGRDENLTSGGKKGAEKGGERKKTIGNQ